MVKHIGLIEYSVHNFSSSELKKKVTFFFLAAVPTPSSKTMQSLTSTVLTQVQTTAGRFWNPRLESYIKLFKSVITGSRIGRNRLIVVY